VDEYQLGLYSTDAGLFQVRPLAVATPRHEEAVQTLVRYAAEQQISLTARGAATGSGGGSLGPGVIVDFAPHFCSILNVRDDTVTAQPGVVVQRLNDRLAAEGRRIVPTPDNPEACTIGGVVAVNGSGLRVAHDGYPGERLISGRMVLDSGDAVEF